MGNANCGCTGPNAVLVINTAIKQNYLPIDIILSSNKSNPFDYYSTMNIQFCLNNSIGPFFMETKANDASNSNEEANKMLNELIAITDFEKYIQTKNEVSVLEYEEFYSNGKIEAIKTIPFNQLKQHLLFNSSSIFRVPLYLSLLTNTYISYSRKHISIDDNTKIKHQIEVDLPRTFPKIDALTKKEFLINFRSLLYEIAGRDTRISYVQGMNFIGALCLLLSGNQLETGFVLYAKVLSLKSSLFRMAYKECFNYDFPLLIKYLVKAKELLMKYQRSIYDKIVEYDVNEHTWLSKWILTLFLSQFEINIVLKFWDVLISQGIDSILIICLTIVEIYKEELEKTESLIEFSRIICHEMVIDKERSELLIQRLIHNINNRTYALK